MHAQCTKAPYLPKDRPPQRPTTMPVHFPMNDLTLRKLWRCTPARTPFISGTPEPSASLLMYSPTLAQYIMQIQWKEIQHAYLM